MIRAALLTLVLASPSFAQLASLNGRVLDAAGKPVAARIAVAEVGRATILFPNPDEMLVITPGESGETRKRCSRLVTASADGAFAIPDLQPGQYGVVAADPERGIAICDYVLVVGINQRQVTLEPPRFLDMQINGPTFDPSKHVLEVKPAVWLGNVNVVPRLVQNGWSFRTGPLPAVDPWIVIGTELVLEHDYRATLFKERRTAGPDKQLLDWKVGDQVTGQVRAPGGAPLEGVSVVGVRYSMPGYERGAVTDANGNYTLRLANSQVDSDDGEVQVRRWIVRDTAGCGNGPADVVARRAFKLEPFLTPTQVDVELDELAPQLPVGALAPDFEATTLDGPHLKLSDLRGKVVLVDFWATWCAMCRAELPELEKFYAERSKDGRFEIVAVSIDDEPELVRRFLASRKLPWPQIALGPVDVNPITRLYNVWGTPNTVLIDRDGKIAARNLLGAELRAKIDELLAKQ